MDSLGFKQVYRDCFLFGLATHAHHKGVVVIVDGLDCFVGRRNCADGCAASSKLDDLIDFDAHGVDFRPKQSET